MRLDLIFSMRDIYINSNLNALTKFTSSSRSTKFKDILPWNISQMITKTIPISTRIVISYAMKWGILQVGQLAFILDSPHKKTLIKTFFESIKSLIKYSDVTGLILVIFKLQES